MNKIISLVQISQGKKRYFLSFFVGVCVTLAFPPIYIVPFAIVGFTLHLIQIEFCQNKKQAFWLGWWFGLGHFTTGLYWISFALLTDFEKFWWLMPFAILGIPVVLAFYTAIVSWLTFLVPQSGYRRVIIFTVLWTIIEFVRGYLFTGFPWNLVGYIWVISDSMLQLASVFGVWGLTFFTILAFSMPATLFFSNGKKNFYPISISFALLVIIWVGGFYRLQTAEIKDFPNVMVRIIQPNIAQDNKWDMDKRSMIVQKHLNMTYSEGFDKITHVIWPESALPFYIEENSELLDIIKHVVPKGGAIITGSIRAQVSESGFVEKAWNSLHAIDNKGHIAAVYDKHHLVPFGEYVPLRGILPIEKITQGQGDFESGDGVKTLSIPNFPKFSPLICYEAIFPGAVADEKDRPELMINVTNDGWYGKSSGPYQHFEIVRLRAVEEGVSLIRSANTGISGLIDPYGRVVKKAPLEESAIIDSSVPKNLADGTIYSKYGNLLLFLVIVASLTPILLNFIQKK